jgi:hypothetical protein
MLTEPQPVTIRSDAFYDDDLLSHVLGVTRAILARACKSGQLRFSAIGSRRLYQGRWVLDWLSAEPKEAAVVG